MGELGSSWSTSRLQLLKIRRMDILERKRLPGRSWRACGRGMGHACRSARLLHGAALTCVRRTSAMCAEGGRESCCPEAWLWRVTLSEGQPHSGEVQACTSSP